MSKSRVLVTCPPMLAAICRFEKKFADMGVELFCPDVVQVMSEKELINLVPQYDGWIIGDDPATRPVFEAGKAGRLKAAVKWGIGVDNVDFEAAQSLGIPITNTPGMFGAEVADVAICYTIGLARELFWIDSQVKKGEWPKPSGMSMAGKTVGLVGFGDIGRSYAERALALGVDLIIYDPAFTEEESGHKRRFEPWPKGIEACDFLVFTCALNKHNMHMFDNEIVSNLRQGVRIINVARGPLIDEGALVAGLKSGTIHSAALDVMEIEPLPTDSELRKFEKCVFGSHNSSNTVEAVTATSHKAIELLFDFLKLG